MTNLANMNLEINEDVIKTIFEQTLNQSIISAMGNKEEYMSALINSALSQKVDENGNVSRYSSDNKFTFVDTQVKKAIRDASKDAIEEYIEENKELLKATVKKEMEKEENKSALVNSFVKGAMNAFDYNYNFSANLNIEKTEY
ncbi:hypothetical protein [Enterococcus sp. DIV1054d]|uniref:hypothetical protein n=1 Tax=Enterococcus sp. DIV1054d TaxID=2774789 RepID=UPI003D2FE2CA